MSLDNWKNFYLSILLLLFFAVGIVVGGCDTDELSGQLQGIIDRWASEEEQSPLPDPPDSEFNSQIPSEEKLAEDEDHRLSKLYYPEEDKKFLIPVTRIIPYEEGIARTTVEALVDQPRLKELLAEVSLIPALPEGTEVIGIAINEELARINFNSSFLDYPEEDERLVLSSLHCTLKQFPSIEKVQVLVEGSFLEEFPGGTSGKKPLGPECRINLVVDEELENYQEDHSAVTVFWVYPVSHEKHFYVPVTKVMKPREDELKAAIQELLKGSQKRPGVFSNLPGGVELIDLNSEDPETVVVKLSSEVLNIQGGRTGEENLINQLVLTIGKNSNAERIMLEIEGGVTKLPYGTDLTSPLPVPSFMNYLGDN